MLQKEGGISGKVILLLSGDWTFSSASAAMGYRDSQTRLWNALLNANPLATEQQEVGLKKKTKKTNKGSGAEAKSLRFATEGREFVLGEMSA